MKILIFGKSNDPQCDQAISFLGKKLEGMGELQVFRGIRGEPFPMDARNWRGDVIISYLSQWIIPESVLKSAKIASINFHPGPPEYPGVGCTNFAIYNEEKEFGISCHHMDPTVDTGTMIRVDRFPLLASDSVLDLTQKCYAQILKCFESVMTEFFTSGFFPTSKEVWKRKPYNRVELNELGRLEKNMDDKEVMRRIRAMTFPGYPGAFFDHRGENISVHCLEDFKKF